MKKVKRFGVMLLTLSMVTMSFTACGKATETSTEPQTESQVVADDTTEAAETTETSDVETAETTKTSDVETAETITAEEAIELVKAELGDEFGYVAADELEEKDGSQYYAIYVQTLLDEGNVTTVTTYLVKTDGSELFDKYVETLYVGEYVHTGETGETIFKVFEDNTFEMVTTGVVNQVVSGTFEFGVTDSATVFVLNLYPQKIVTKSDDTATEEEVTDVQGTAVIEDGTLTLSMESEETIFTKTN